MGAGAAQLVRDFKPDVLFTQSITVAAVAGLAAPRIPHVVMLHGIPDDQERLAAVVLRSTRAHAVAVSDQTAHGITRHRGAPPVETLRSGIDISALERNAEVPIDPPLPDGSPRYIYIGRFVPQKATGVLVAAFARVVAQYPQAQLVCAGIGPELDERKQQAADLGIAERIVFLGAVGNVAPYIRASDAFVLSSRWEGLPVVLLGDARPRHAGHRDGGRRLAARGARRRHGLAGAAGGRRRVRGPHAGGRRGPGGAQPPRRRERRALIARDYDAERVLDRIDAMLREAVAPLPLPPRPYHSAVRRLERARTRRAASDGLPQPGTGVRILAYHRVADEPDVLAVRPAAFRAHMELLLASGATPIRLDAAVDLLARPGRRRWACVTFDDGYRDSLETRCPSCSGSASATVFAVTAFSTAPALPLVPGSSAGPLLGGRRGAAARRRVRRAAAQPDPRVAAGASTRRPRATRSSARRASSSAPPDAVDRLLLPGRPLRRPRAAAGAGGRLAAAVGTGPGVNAGGEDGLLRCGAPSSARTRRRRSSPPCSTARSTRTPGCTGRCEPAARGGEALAGR